MGVKGALPWTIEEDNLLTRYMNVDGLSLAQAAHKLGRSRCSATGRWWRLRGLEAPKPAAKPRGPYRKFATVSALPRERQRPRFTIFDHCTRSVWNPARDPKPEWLQRSAL